MKLYIFDTNNLFYRAFWGSDPLTTSDGFPTQGLHGFFKLVNSIIALHKPDQIAFAMEGGSLLRKNLDANYKANRPEVPKDILDQLKVLPQLINAFKWPSFKKVGYEADDIIAQLAKDGTSLGYQVVIVSSDKDFCQLVSDQVSLFNISKDEMVTPQGVHVKYGVYPHQFLDYLSIVGDTSDNVKGIQGVGPKGAMDLLVQFGTLDNIYRNTNLIKGARQKHVLAGADTVKLAKKLIAFMPIGQLISDQDAYLRNPNSGYTDELRPMLRKYELKELESSVLGVEVINVGGVDIGVKK